MAQTDANAYYGYLFEPNKQPTKVLDALLRGIANYIIEFVGSKDDKCLTPAKLATFYKAVGGNYDSLFVDVPYPSISWIYASIGCQHTLQPTNDEFAPPSIPALTTKGFVRWQSIEILLGPEEHVPFIQNAVRNFAIKHPDTEESFPIDLPKEAFPLKADTDIVKWHNQCAEKLRQRATPDEDDGLRPNLPPRPKVQAGYAHVRVPSSYHTRPRPEVSDYFEPKSRGAPQRPIPYQHVPSNGRPVRPVLSHAPAHRSRQFLAPESPESPRLARSRRRSFPENMNSSPITSPNGIPSPVDPRSPPVNEHVRRHSHPRQARRGSVSSDASSEAEPISPLEPRRKSSTRHAKDGKPSIRFEFPPPTSPQDPRLRHYSQDEELKRRSYPVPIDRSGKLSEPFLLGKRDRDTREKGGNGGRSHNVTWKDLSGVQDIWRRGSKSSEDDREKISRDQVPISRRQSRDERMGEDRDSGSGGRSDYKRRDKDKERDRERDRDGERPRVGTRRSHSSHEERPREWEREAGGSGRSFRERDRDRRALSPIRGVDGRYYPPVR